MVSELVSAEDSMVFPMRYKFCSVKVYCLVCLQLAREMKEKEKIRSRLDAKVSDLTQVRTLIIMICPMKNCHY